ncbi:uncharacterized protein [Procambarus clarkii]|uniref:uncharacterized protein n=1 Tax=Procambarus clarkii TaxID=6728 RepID=UPI001E672D13|nr:uncharacterized protein LOC123764155 [Procambarus clarkii]
MIALAVVSCLLVVLASGLPQEPASGHLPQPQFHAGFTPEVEQATSNFHAAYNYLAELALLAPDDPTTTTTTGFYPLGYQYGGLSPEVARATTDFFRKYMASAVRAQASSSHPQ